MDGADAGDTPGATTRRGIGVRLSGALLHRRLAELEQRLALVASTGGPGCAVCAGWPPNAVVEVGDAAEGVPGSSLLARYGAHHRAEEPPGWPPGLRCGACGRTPLHVIRLVYAERGPTTGHLRAWRPGATS